MMKNRIPPSAYRRIISFFPRVLLVLVAFSFLNTPPAYVTPGPPQTVLTDEPTLCVHTRLIDEVEEWKIKQSLVMVREMGAATIVEFFPWAYLEPEEGHYAWARSDMIIGHATNQGLRVIARLGLVPDWARPDPDETNEETSLNYLDEAHFAAFANFVEAFTTRYRGQVDQIIVWNEPNLAFEWGYQPVDPEKYVDLLRQVTPAAHRGNPDVIVLAGALAPTLEPVGSPFGMVDVDYLQALYEAGFASVFDALAVHTYGFKFPAEAEPAEDVLNFRRIELLREIMIANGDGEKRVVITEFGWNDHPRWTRAVSPAQRITYTIDAYEYVKANWDYVDAACLWAFRYPAPTYSYPDYFTLVAPDFSPKPIYEALKAWARGEA